MVWREGRQRLVGAGVLLRKPERRVCSATEATCVCMRGAAWMEALLGQRESAEGGKIKGVRADGQTYLNLWERCERRARSSADGRQRSLCIGRRK